VSLTNAAVSVLQSFEYLKHRMPEITVISTCADLDRFKPLSIDKRGKGFVLGYVGTVGTWYLFDEVLYCFSLLLLVRPDAKILIVNRSEHDYIHERLIARRIPETSVEVIMVTHAEVPRQMARMDAGIFFIKPVFSKLASAPTKLAEFLGCGIPCLGNTGVGDMAEVLEAEKVGVALTSFTENSMKSALSKLLLLAEEPDIRNNCVKAAQKHFSLKNGVSKYENIYLQLR
jgi:glycosyltransferase involved in cell wall biosynthesis